MTARLNVDSRKYRNQRLGKAYESSNKLQHASVRLELITSFSSGLQPTFRYCYLEKRLPLKNTKKGKVKDYKRK